MNCAEVMACLEKLSPLSFAEDWDNVGLLAGRRDKEVARIYLAVDATDAVIADAIDKNTDLLLTHHPLLFCAVKRVNTDDFIGRRLVALLQHDISYVAMHTNFDVKGMADEAAGLLGLIDCEVLDVTFEEEGHTEGIGRIGRMKETLTMRQLAEHVKEAFRVDAVRLFGDAEAQVKRVALCPGSGKSVIEESIRKGANVLVTGDIDHHEGIDAVAQGLHIIDAGHYGIEKIFLSFMQTYLCKELPEMTVFTEKEKNPFLTI